MGWLSRLSVRTKAPLTVAIIVLLVGGAISTAAYLVIRRTLHEHAVIRLTTLVTQYRETFRGNMATSRARAMEAANKPEILAYVQQPGPDREGPAREALKPAGPQSEFAVLSEVLDQRGQILLTYPAAGDPGLSRYPSIAQTDGAALVALVPAASSGVNVVGYGRFHQDGDAILYPTVVRLPGSPGAYYVSWRRLQN